MWLPEGKLCGISVHLVILTWNLKRGNQTWLNYCFKMTVLCVNVSIHMVKWRKVLALLEI